MGDGIPIVLHTYIICNLRIIIKKCRSKLILTVLLYSMYKIENMHSTALNIILIGVQLEQTKFIQ